MGLTQVLAFEAGRKHKIRVNTISAGILFTLYWESYPHLKWENNSLVILLTGLCPGATFCQVHAMGVPSEMRPIGMAVSFFSIVQLKDDMI